MLSRMADGFVLAGLPVTLICAPALAPALADTLADNHPATLFIAADADYFLAHDFLSYYS